MGYSTLVFREVDDDGCVFYVARHPELPGCTAQGESPEAALVSLSEAKSLYLEALTRHQVPIPAPALLIAGSVYAMDLSGVKWGSNGGK